MDGLVGVAATIAPASSRVPASPRRILVLRNNDIGDLIVITPLFEALRRQFPSAQIVAGIGTWNREVLANNPFVDGIVPVNAPWHNKVVSPQSPGAAVRYLWRSSEVLALRRAAFDVGIDVLGSPWGALLLMQARIPWRIGVRGYAGGHLGVQQYVEFNPTLHVGEASLRFAALLGAREVPPNRPRIYLTTAEEAEGERVWKERSRGARRTRVVIGPGGGFPEKCWPSRRFGALVHQLATDPSLQVIVVGGSADIELARSVAASAAVTLAGQTSLRQLFGLVSRSDLVICNSSMLMHVGAAFSRPTVVLLGDAMPPAHEHAALWGYPGITQVCGRDTAASAIWSVERAASAIREQLSQLNAKRLPTVTVANGTERQPVD